MSSPGTMTCPKCKSDIFYLDGVTSCCNNCGWVENEFVNKKEENYKISIEEAEKLLRSAGFKVKIDNKKRGLLYD